MATSNITRMGESSDYVKNVQKALIAAGYDVGKSGADGIYGKDTAAAIKAFKTATGGSNTYGNTFGKETTDKLFGTSTGKTESLSNTVVNPPVQEEPQNEYNKLYEQYALMLNSAGSKSSPNLDAAMANQKTNTNQAYDNNARQYYQLLKTEQADLPEELSRAGVTGGATESANLKLLNAYGNNIYNSETARQKALRDIESGYYEQQASLSAQQANKAADAYLQLMQEQMAYEQATAANEAQQKQDNSITTWNNNVANRMAQQLAKGDTIWTWTDADGKDHWSTYKATGLANGGKMLTTTDKKKIVNSSSSSSGTTEKTEKAKVNSDNLVSNIGAANVYNNISTLINGVTTTSGLSAANIAIDTALKNDKITQKEADKLGDKLMSAYGNVSSQSKGSKATSTTKKK